MEQERDFNLCILEANIGAGKSTLAKELKTVLDKVSGAETFVAIEPADESEGKVNPFLPRFYTDENKPNRWSFATQIWVLKERLRQMVAAQFHVQRRVGHAILDRSFYFDTAFALTLLEMDNFDQLEYQTYIELYESMTCFVKHPHIAIWMAARPEVCLARIKKRAAEKKGRETEVAITIEYLAHLERNMLGVLDVLQRDCGVHVIRDSYSATRDTPELRAETVLDLARAIDTYVPKPNFFSRHKRLV